MNKIKQFAYGIVCTLAVLTSSATGLPAEYTRVVGIKSAGLSSNAPYIDLGYKPTQNTRVDIDFELLDWGCGQYNAVLDNYPCPFGACHANNALAFTLTGGGSLTDGPCWSYRWGDGSGGGWIISGAIVEGPHRLEANCYTWTLDGFAKEKTGGSSETFSMNTSLFVFARNNNGTMDHPVYMTLYGFDIYENGVLQHSFVPCIRNSDSEPGLYDVVGAKGFLVKSGSGAFTVAESYLETEGVPQVVCDSILPPQPVVHPYGANSIVLVEGTDYMLSYGRRTSSDGYNFGWVKATGIGNYAGVDSRKIWYRIFDQATNDFSVAQIAPVAYKNGQPCTPRPVVRTADGSRTLAEGADYDLSYCSNYGIGRGYVVINGKGDFAGKIWTEPFSILPVLPSGYKAAEYIRGFGQQYIDTGFKPDTNTRADIRFDVESAPKMWEPLFGSRQSSTQKKFYIVYNFARQKWSCNIAATSAWEPEYPAAVGEHFFSIDKTTFTLDGVSQTLSATAFDKTYNAYVFSINDNGSPMNIDLANLTMKLYSLKIWDNGTLVREFVPCVNKDGEAGLYDITPGAEKKYYANDGTGTFEAGPVLASSVGLVIFFR